MLREKKSNAKRLPPPVWLHLCDILADEELQEQKTDEWLPEAGVQGDMRGELRVSVVTEGVHSPDLQILYP